MQTDEIKETPNTGTHYTFTKQQGYTRRLSAHKRGFSDHLSDDSYVIAYVSPNETPEGINEVIREIEGIARGEVMRRAA
jgi:hypothetical protein